MKILSLFDGISCGHVAFERAGIEIEEYWASEVDKYAITISQHNHKDIKHIGDIRYINGSDYDADIVIGGSPCFIAGTKVITEKAYKNIEDIKVGDMVLTHNNRYQRVVNVGNQQSRTIILYAQGMKPTETTANHPYYARRMVRKYDSVSRACKRTFSDPEWIPAGELKKDDFIAMPILQKEENPRNLTKEDCWLIGRYIADGHIRKTKRKYRKNSYQYQVVYSVGNHKVDEFLKNISRHVSCYPHTKSTHRIVVNSMEFLELLEDIGTGKGAINKNIPMEILNLPNDLLKAVLDGYISGDGYKKGDRFTASSISEQLILTINLAIAKIYRVNSMYSYCKTPSKCIIEGRTVNMNDSYSTAFMKELKKQSNAIVDGNIIWTRFNKSEETGSENMVYNLEVDIDNSYTANNFIVHNCQNLSVSGSRKGFSTSTEEVHSLDQYLELKDAGAEFHGQSYLFWEYIRILREVNPAYFLLENVVMAKKWEEIITQELGVEPIKINSSLVSAQNRNRLYWTNIPGVRQPGDKGIRLSDIVFDDAVFCYTRPRGKNNGGITPGGKSSTASSSAWQDNSFAISLSNVHGGFKEGVPRIHDNHSPTIRTAKGGGHIPSLLHSKAAIEYMGRKTKDGRTHWDFQYHSDTSNDKSHAVVANFYEGVPYNVLKDNHIIRKFHPVECERLQTLPDNYTAAPGVSDTQRYRGIGNGWTVDVIAHIFSYIFSQDATPVIKYEQHNIFEVL